MSVLITGGPDISLFPGWVDPRLPIGRWTTDISGNGNATGGNVNVSLHFHQSTSPMLPLSFSVQRIACARGLTTADHANLRIEGFSLSGVDGPELDYRETIELLPSNDRRAGIHRGWDEFFVGVPMVGQLAALTVAFLNNDNGDVYDLQASGQLWLYEGMLQLGGPQNPQSMVPALSGPSHPQGATQKVRDADPLEKVETMVITPAGPVIITAPAPQLQAAVTRVRRLAPATQSTIAKAQSAQRTRTAALAAAAAAGPAVLASGRTLAAAQAGPVAVLASGRTLSAAQASLAGRPTGSAAATRGRTSARTRALASAATKAQHSQNK